MQHHQTTGQTIGHTTGQTTGRSRRRRSPASELTRWIAVAMLSVAGACTSDIAGSEPASRAPDPEAASRALTSGVGILALGCGQSASGGSGVVIGVAGQVVTVAHTVAGATSIVVVDGAGTQFGARVVAFDPAADLAVLAVDGLDIAPLMVAEGDVLLGAATLVTWSNDGGVEASTVDVTQRLAITIDDIYGTHSVERSGFEFAGDVVVGDSGGPVVASAGGVMGIVYARSQTRASTGFATDATEINALLDAVGAQAVDNGACI